jgi:hypothetical protein
VHGAWLAFLGDREVAYSPLRHCCIHRKAEFPHEKGTRKFVPKHFSYFFRNNLRQEKADSEEEGDVRTGLPAPAGGLMHRLAYCHGVSGYCIAPGGNNQHPAYYSGSVKTGGSEPLKVTFT